MDDVNGKADAKTKPQTPREKLVALAEEVKRLGREADQLANLAERLRHRRKVARRREAKIRARCDALGRKIPALLKLNHTPTSTVIGEWHFVNHAALAKFGPASVLPVRYLVDQIEREKTRAEGKAMAERLYREARGGSAAS